MPFFGLEDVVASFRVLEEPGCAGITVFVMVSGLVFDVSAGEGSEG